MRLRWFIVVTVVAFALAAPLASASTVKWVGSKYQVEGGEFTMKAESADLQALLQFNGPDPYTWQSFCVETREHIAWNVAYDNSSVNFDGTDSYAIYGGTLPKTQDPLDTRTAYLYTKFFNKTLDGYAYDGINGADTADQRASARALQHVIWYLEEEDPSYHGGGPNDGSPDWAANSLEMKFWNDAAANAAAWGLANNGIGNVRIINLWKSGDSTEYQDQLAMVPLPGAGLAGLTLLAGIAAVRARRRRRG